MISKMSINDEKKHNESKREETGKENDWEEKNANQGEKW